MTGRQTERVIGSSVPVLEGGVSGPSGAETQPFRGGGGAESAPAARPQSSSDSANAGRPPSETLNAHATNATGTKIATSAWNA